VWNRTLVIITNEHFLEMRYFRHGIPQEFHYRAPIFWADYERRTTAYHSVSLSIFRLCLAEQRCEKL